MSVYGYMRIKREEKKKAEELFALYNEYPIPKENFFIDEPGLKKVRSEYMELKKKLRSGDLIVLPSLDKLGYNYEGILREWRELTQKYGVEIKILDKPLLDTRKGEEIASIVMAILECVADRERGKSKLQAEGIRAAKERGVRFGRPQLKYSAEFIDTAERFRKKQITLQDALGETGLKKSGLYYHLHRLIELGIISK